ncbi:hypothetical protein Y1Q_0005618 [Alligator mississippiensis]|uniref:Uncharacterized protein n=1 Tax=Alligator mississippiensis TaxID=8496 RepID=A0A151MFB5_ALLMI|nr:hypothetical protein Y1Q_0005618 [Alligator mississippiensis]
MILSITTSERVFFISILASDRWTEEFHIVKKEARKDAVMPPSVPALEGSDGYYSHFNLLPACPAALKCLSLMGSLLDQQRVILDEKQPCQGTAE